MATGAQKSLQAEIEPHYGLGLERDRLARRGSQLEFARTCEVIRRFLPPGPLSIADIGGGPGAYALWLARLGHRIHLRDLMPLHVEQAAAASAAQAHARLASCEVGDARDLDLADGSCDLVLLLGPLYHLVERSDRLRAWSEAKRILKPGGIVIAAAISRFASACDGMVRNLISDPEFMAIVRRDLVDGRHANPSNQADYFTTAYFHRPEELAAEVAAAGLAHLETLAVEGPAWLMASLEEHWKDPARQELLLEVLRAIEREPSILGASAHLLAAARK